MQPAGARALREDDEGMSREAVLLQWERKIEDAERRESGRFERPEDEVAERRERGRFERPSDEDGPVAEPVPLRPVEDATSQARRFERSAEAPAAPVPVPDRRTVTIAGRPGPAPVRRRRSVVEAQMAQPDRIALWAFLLGLFLVAVAAGTAHA
jgi:hypothetical protein